MMSAVFREKTGRLIQYIRGRPFFILLGGAGLAHLINFASAPLLTRLYTPDAFGLLSIFATTLAVAGAVAGGRYEQAIIGETSDKSANELVFVVGLLAMMLASLLPLLFTWIAPLLNSRTHISEVAMYLAPAVFAYSLGQAFTSWLIRRGGFSTTSGAKIIQSLFVFGTSLCFVGESQGLVVANMTGYLAACVVLGGGAYRNGWPGARATFQEIWTLLRRQAKFPLMGALPALFDSLSMLLPVYWIAIYFSATDTGYFGLTRQVLAAPVGMISLVISQLLMKRLADANAGQASMVPALRRVLYLVSAPVLAFGVLISAVGPELFDLLFGDAWRPAGSIARWMVWAYIAPMLVSPLSIVLIVLRKIGSNGAWQTAHCAGLCLIVAFGQFGSIGQFVQILVVYELVSYAAYAVVIAYAVYGYEKNRDAK